MLESDVSKASPPATGQLGLQRKAHLEEAAKDSMRQIISDKIRVPWSLKGYSGMWNKLNTTYGIAVARDCVIQILKEADLG